jgi:hypothetical protein
MSKAAAFIKIKDAGNMNKKGRRDIANWLRKEAKALVKDGHLYGRNIIIRYLYKD